ncbi:MAG: pilus assembly protein PilF, partial [Dolichospermum sp.]
MRNKLQEKVKHPSLSPKQVPRGIEAKRDLQAAFDLSWEELKPEAKHLACVLAAFTSSLIYWYFVIQIYQQLQGESFNHDNLKNRWLKFLTKLHLVIKVDRDIYNLHLLIHDYFYEHLKQHSEYSQIKQTYCDIIVNIASIINQLSNLKTFNLIEPHLKKMINCYENKKNINFAYSLNQLAILYKLQGKYNKAKRLDLQFLDISERQLSNDYPNTRNTTLAVKLLYVIKFLQCNKDTLFSILEALAKQANFPE